MDSRCRGNYINTDIKGCLHMKYALTYDSPVGTLWLAEENGSVTDLRFGPIPDGTPSETPILRQALEQLKAYFNGSLQRFDLPLAPSGTPFQKSCWDALLTIPYGETRTYSDLAQAVGKPTARRAVGSANHHNPISIIIPCHRVIGKSGALVGYGGGLDVKRTLLALEEKYK
jgi:methylated-DNA-[protein]-cysteine S-methyltransferase